MEQRTGRIAIVTGASRGIGAAVAERLARDGFTVVINYSGDAAPAEALVRKIEDKGGRALAAKADVSDAQAVRGMFDAAEAAFGGVDVLVNNAGIMPLSTIADTGDATFERLIDVNLKGTFNTLREAARRLRNGCRRASASSGRATPVTRTIAGVPWRSRRWHRLSPCRASISSACKRILVKPMCRRCVTATSLTSRRSSRTSPTPRP